MIIVGKDLLIGRVVRGDAAILFGLSQMATMGIGTSCKGVGFCHIVEENGSFFESATLGLDGEEVDVDGLQDVPDRVNDVVLPVQCRPSCETRYVSVRFLRYRRQLISTDRVGVLVENQGCGNGQAKGEFS